jgi:hypothetical protein
LRLLQMSIAKCIGSLINIGNSEALNYVPALL